MTYKIDTISVYIRLTTNAFASNVDYYADDPADTTMNILDIDANGEIIGIEAIINGDEFVYDAMNEGNNPHSLGDD